MEMEGILEELQQEFGAKRNGDKASQEATEKRKSAPKPDSLVLVSQPSANSPTVRLPTVRPYSESRMARKEAEAELKRQWEIVQTTQRTALATNSMVAVAVHAERQLEQGAQAIVDCYFSRNRHKAANQFMAKVSTECLARMQAGVMAILETHPKRLGEDL